MLLLIMAIALVALFGYQSVYLDYKLRHAQSRPNQANNSSGFSFHPTTNSLRLNYSDQQTVLAPATIKSWYQSYTRDYTGQIAIRPNADKIIAYLYELSSKTNTPPINAKLDYRDGKISEFVYPHKGHMLNISASYATITQAMAQQQPTAELIFQDSDPSVTLDKINNLGIKKLLGRGESDFGNSSAARITNIRVSSELFNNIVVHPGEEFSFNKILGNVDAVNGYQPELVIKGHNVIKEYGGGICQVATTVFRAAILSGLKILERHPHAFPVGHYNPQGFDATIYPGSADLRFVNDTTNLILIQTTIKGTKIYFDFYGADDRQVTMTQPVQYDIQPDGAMKAVFSRNITFADGTTKKETFRSSYKSPSLFPTLHNPLE